MEIIYKKVSDLVPYENNPRKNDDAVQYVANSIKEFGFRNPIIIGKDNVIASGHTRLKAAIKLGMTEVPCLIADDLTEEQLNAFRLADNKVAEMAEWDFGKLMLELDEISIDMGLFGFDRDTIQIEDIDLKDLEEFPEEPFAHELGEANNYIVLEFCTETDWELAQDVFNLQRVQTNEPNPNVRKHGIGRVIDGAEIMGRLVNED